MQLGSLPALSPGDSRSRPAGRLLPGAIGGAHTALICGPATGSAPLRRYQRGGCSPGARGTQPHPSCAGASPGGTALTIARRCSRGQDSVLVSPPTTWQRACQCQELWRRVAAGHATANGALPRLATRRIRPPGLSPSSFLLAMLMGCGGGQAGPAPWERLSCPFLKSGHRHALFVSLKPRPPSCFQRLRGVLPARRGGLSRVTSSP